MPFKFVLANNAANKEMQIEVSGTLTFHQHHEGEQLVHQITSIITEGGVSSIRMNFSAVERMDSHWLGVLIRILRRVQEHKASFVIEKPSAEVRNLFEMVELNRIATIHA